MVVAVMFDTLAYAQKLQAVGVAEAVATVQAQALAELANDHLATKEDVQLLRNETKQIEERLNIRIDRLRDEMYSHCDKLTYQLTIRLGGLMTTGVVILGALIKY